MMKGLMVSHCIRTLIYLLMKETLEDFLRLQLIELIMDVLCVLTEIYSYQIFWKPQKKVITNI